MLNLNEWQRIKLNSKCYYILVAAIASQKQQTDLLAIQNWFKKLKMNANESKSIHVTFTTRRETCPRVHINSVQLPQEEDVK
jgi:hypothetical protein